MQSVFVGDGYDLRGRIAAVPGLHPRVDIRYRPAAMRIRLREKMARNADELDDVLAQIFFEQISEFRVGADLKGNGGETIKLTVEQYKTLHANIHQGIYNYVFGWSGPDLAEEEKNSGGAPT